MVVGFERWLKTVTVCIINLASTKDSGQIVCFVKEVLYN